ncbi:MAG: hypothetical protein K2M95_07060 [Clostridiales bacterium]|nr:hypothetical protein [Clostridiales bacterium]
MSLLDLYLEKNGEKNWQNLIRDEKENLYLFDFTTNFRDLHKFEDGFATFKKLCEMTDEERKKYVEDSPEQAKRFSKTCFEPSFSITRAASSS